MAKHVQTWHPGQEPFDENEVEMEEKTEGADITSEDTNAHTFECKICKTFKTPRRFGLIYHIIRKHNKINYARAFYLIMNALCFAEISFLFINFSLVSVHNICFDKNICS